MIDHGAQGCGANHIQAPAKMATQSAKYRSNQSDRGDQNSATPTPPGVDDPIRSLAKPYQNAIASAVQTIADRKNSFGRGKNETNMVLGIQAWVRGLADSLMEHRCMRRRPKTPYGRRRSHA